MLEIGDLAKLLDCSRRSARRRIAEKCSAGSKSASSSSKHWPVSGVISLAQTRPENLPMAAWKARRLEPIALRRDPRAREAIGRKTRPKTSKNLGTVTWRLEAIAPLFSRKVRSALRLRTHQMGENSRVVAKLCDNSLTIFGPLGTKSRGHSRSG